MEQIMLDIINKFGYIGIAFLIAIENIFPPIPSEVILTFGGFMTTVSSMSVLGVVTSSTIGSVAGALVLYYLGRLLNSNRLELLFESRLGRSLHLKKEDVNRAQRWFLKHGNKTVFFCRFIPLIRSLISIPAGAAKMKIGRFLFLTTIGTAIWNIVLVLLGKFAGDAWSTIVGYFDIYSIAAVVILIILFVIAGIIFFKKRFFNTQKIEGKNDIK